MIPQAGAGLFLGGQTGEGVHQGTIFLKVLVQELGGFARQAKGKGEEIKDQDKWKCNDPPKGSEKSTHLDRLCLRQICFGRQPASQ